MIMRRIFRLLTIALLVGLTGLVLQACTDEEDTTNDPYNQTSGLQVGDEAPYFALPAARGGDVTLTQYTDNNQPVLLFFHMADG